MGFTDLPYRVRFAGHATGLGRIPTLSIDHSGPIPAALLCVRRRQLQRRHPKSAIFAKCR